MLWIVKSYTTKYKTPNLAITKSKFGNCCDIIFVNKQSYHIFHVVEIKCLLNSHFDFKLITLNGKLVGQIN